jgi:hypothetical protein
MVLYVTVRKRPCEVLGAYTSYALARECVNQKVESNQATIDQTFESESEGWQWLGASDEEMFLIQIVKLDELEPSDD